MFGVTAQGNDKFNSFNGVMTSENGINLYNSDSAVYALKGRFLDYVILGSGVGFLTGVSPWLFMPFVACSLALPRKWGAMAYFCFHAELLPHTE